MPNKIKYKKAVRDRIKKLYAAQRVEGGLFEDGTRYNSTGKYSLREISEKTGVPIPSVNAIAKGHR